MFTILVWNPKIYTLKPNASIEDLEDPSKEADIPFVACGTHIGVPREFFLPVVPPELLTVLRAK